VPLFLRLQREAREAGLLIEVRDVVTKKPVVASTVRLDGEVIAHNVTEIRIQLPGHLTERRAELIIEAPGYEKADYEFRWNLRHSRVFRLTAWLAPRDQDTK